MDEISDHAKNLTLSEDLERTVEERVNILFDFVKVSICENAHKEMKSELLFFFFSRSLSALELKLLQKYCFQR